MRYFLFFMAVFCPFLSVGQSKDQLMIDSLLAENKRTLPDTQRVLNLGQIATLLYKINANEGVRYAQEALKLAQKIKWKDGMVTANNALGKNYIQLSQSGIAYECYFRALKIAEETGNKLNIGLTNLSLGKAYIGEQGDNKTKALKYLHEAKRLFTELEDAMNLANANNNLGTVYNYGGKHDSALHYYGNALRLFDSLNYIPGRIVILSNTATLYDRMLEVDKSLEYSLKALEMCEKNSLPTNFLLGNIGGTYMSIAIDSSKNKYLQLLFNGDKKAAIQKSLEYLHRYYDTCVKIGNINSLASSSFDLAVALEQNGDYKASLQMFKINQKWNDSIAKFNNAQILEEQETQREVLLKNKQIELDKLAVAKKRNDRGFLIAGMVLLTIVIIFISRERRKSEQLLLNILPESIAKRLKQKEHPIADHFSEASIIFIDMAGFTGFSQGRDPKATVSTLNDIFTSFDALAEKHGLEKIKTIGDCYMAVAGLPEPRIDHIQAAADMAREVKASMNGYKTADGTEISFRIGLDCGPVVAGIIGKKKFIYDLWGDAVNTASRMESTGVAGEAHCTDNFKNKLGAGYSFTSRGMIEVKGKGSMQTWLLN